MIKEKKKGKKERKKYIWREIKIVKTEKQRERERKKEEERERGIKRERKERCDRFGLYPHSLLLLIPTSKP